MEPTTEHNLELQRAFDHFNRHLFDGKLPNVMLTLTRNRRTHGYFVASRFASKTRQRCDELAMNPTYFSVRPLKDTLAELVHQMARVWQKHFGTPGRGGYHNVEWADFMEHQLGLMPSDTGRVGGKRCGDHMQHYILEHGPFDRACRALLTDNFMLTWYDRFPPHDPLPATVAPPPSRAAVLARVPETDLLGAVPAAIAAVAPPPAPVTSHLAVAIAAARERNAIAAAKVALDIVVQPAASLKSNRTKYQCGGCAPKVNVWGKPGLNLFCSDCLTRFAAA